MDSAPAEFALEFQTLLEDFNSSEESITLKLLLLKEFVNNISTILAKKSDSDDRIDSLLASIEPTDFSTKRLKLELANSFKRPSVIIDYIQNEEKLLVRRALNFSWMFKAGASRLSNPKFLMEQLFPKVSFSVRSKVINNLSKYLLDEKLCEIMFKTIESKYGWPAALNLLPSCSCEFIQSIWNRNKKQFRPNGMQLLKIAKKNEQLAVDYLDAFYSDLENRRSDHYYFRTMNNKYDKTLKYFLFHHSSGFIQLFEKYYTHVGELVSSAKGTKVLLHSKRNILTNKKVTNYAHFLNQKVISKHLTTDEFLKFFTALLPDSVQEFKDKFTDLIPWLKRFPSEKKIQTVKYAFHKAYGKNIMDCPESISHEYMKLMTTQVEEREILVNLKLQSGDVDENYYPWGYVLHREGRWCAFKGINKAIPEIKAFLSIESDVKIRGELLAYLVHTCCVNGRDSKTLTEVTNYVVSRFRNDQFLVRNTFMKALDENFDLLKFDNKHEIWNPVIELVKLSILNEDNGIDVYLEKVVQHQLVDNQSVHSFLPALVKSKIDRAGPWGPRDMWKLCEKSPEHQKQFLELLVEHFDSTFTDKPLSADIQLKYAILELIESIYEWNRTNSKSSKFQYLSITQFPWLTEKMLEILANGDDEEEKVLKRLLKAIHNDPHVHTDYFESFLTSYPCPQVVNYFIQNKPKKLVEHLDSIILHILQRKNIKDYKNFFHKIKSQWFPELSRTKIVEKCLLTAEDDTFDIKERRNSIVILSLLWDSQNCLNLASYFYPPEAKLNISEDNFETFFEMRKAIAFSLSNIAFPATTFRSISKFCTGDYLKLTVGSLYSVCFNAPQLDALRFLKEELLDRPVSVKKHTIRLVCTISQTEDLPEFLSYLWENETHVSIREAVLQQIFKLISDQPCAENWNLLKAAVLSLSSKDKAGLNVLTQTKNLFAVPITYHLEYFAACWQMLTSDSAINPKIDETNRSTKLSIIDCLMNEINDLKSDGLDKFIRDNLFDLQQHDEVISKLTDFSALYLISSTSAEKCSHQKVIAEAFKRLTGPNWNRTELFKRRVNYICTTEAISTVYPARKALHTFVSNLCENSFDSKEKVRELGNTAVSEKYTSSCIEILKDFLKFLDTQVTELADMFVEKLFLQLSIIFHSHSQNTVEIEKDLQYKDIIEAGKELGKLVDATVSKWSPAILGIFFEKLNSFFEHCYYERLPNNAEVVFLIDGILHCNPLSLENKILAAKLLPSTPTTDTKMEQKYNQVHSQLISFPEKAVHIYVQNRLSEHYFYEL